MSDEVDPKRKAHRASKRGRKAEKKKASKAGKQAKLGEKSEEDANITVSRKQLQQRNPKAFAFNSGIKALKQAQRSQEVQQRRLHAPLVDRSPQDPPPMIVAVVGPPGCGKSSLIRSLVKKYTKRTLQDVKGPITVVAGKKRRLTLLECSNDLHSMIDVAKIADLCLLMINAKHGFQMETFEFLNLLQTHGMPRVLGVLTHLDTFKSVEKLKEVKKKLKHRFWTEIFQGAKLFNFSGILNGKLYLPMETQNLARFISVTKPRPLIWRNSHPYMLADRIEDLTPVEQIKQSDGKTDRTVCLYGWVRGTALKPGQAVHIPGAGDFVCSEASILPDPCPLPSDKDKVEVIGLDGKRKRIRTRLNDKQKRIYAPMSDLSGVIFDQDAVYIDVPEGQSKARGRGEDDGEDSESPDDLDEEGECMLRRLQKKRVDPLDTNVDSIMMPLFKDSAALKGGEFEAQDEDDQSRKEEEKETAASDSESVEDEFLIKRHVNAGLDLEDSFRPRLDAGIGSLSNIKSRFLTSKNDEDNEGENESQGGFEDLEGNGEGEDEDDDDDDAIEGKDESDSKDLSQRRALTKTRFETELDSKRAKLSTAEMDENNYYMMTKARMAEEQTKLDAEFADEPEHRQVELMGCRAGRYVRLVFTGLPCEFIQRHKPTMSIILGGLLANESSLGFCQVRVKKHRWFPKVLKTDEPLIFSIGWRRFQSIPIFSMRDAGTRDRYIKYTPEHMHCMAHFWGPTVSPSTALVAFRSLAEGQSGFRVAAIGTVQEFDASVRVMKKLKLVGYPMKVHRNTAFIKDMFTSSLEVAKFEGASIRTVSGIRGQLKKAIRAPDGAFRATFEDKLLLSDIVFLRTWYAVQPRQFCTPITNILEDDPTRMRLNVELRAMKQQPTPFKGDSLYRDIGERPATRKFNPLIIPKSLQRELPYSTKPKLTPGLGGKRGRQTYRQQRAVLLEPHERKTLGLLSQLSALENERLRKRREKRAEAATKYQKRVAKEAQVRTEKVRRAKMETLAKQSRKKSD